MSNLTPKPKVVAGAVGGIIASAILANVTLITPDLFTGLGKWSALVYGLTITLVISGCAWLKSDGAAAEAAQEAPASDTPVASQPAVVQSAPAATFPAAKVAAAEAAVTVPEPVIAEPSPVAPVFEAPVEVPAPVA